MHQSKKPIGRSAITCALALVVTYLFWVEYLPPFQRQHLYSDIEGYHWPLLAAALDALRAGRLPLWDASIYCGIPFAGNIQAALFYPPSWLLYLVNWRAPHLRFLSLEIWVLLHGTLAFLLCYYWLRSRRLNWLACALGSSAFAFGGYMISQNNHVGVVTGYAWTPLAWMGIDEAADMRSWRPLWKTAAASALCFLAGYPASFTAFAIGTAVYGLARSWRYGLAAIAAIGASLLLAAVQLLPALEASAFKTYDAKYGPGIHDPLFYLHFAVPDWVGFHFADPLPYLYLGIPALLGVPLFLRRPDRAVLSVLAAALLLMINPFNAISALVSRSSFLVQVFPMFSMVEPASLAIALAAAFGIHRFIQSGPSIRHARPAALGTAALLVAWSAYRLAVWPRPVTHWRSVAETAVPLVLCAAGLFLVRRGQTWLAVLLCVAVLVDFKVCGTSRPFSGREGNLDSLQSDTGMPGIEPAAFDAMRAHRQYRVALDAIHPTDLRRYGLATPQGFDPLLPQQYKIEIEKLTSFQSNRSFDISPADAALMRRTGVGYYMTREGALHQREVAANPAFQLVGVGDSFGKVYEYRNAEPPWHFEGAGEVSCRRWEPELREFQLTAGESGRFVFAEQFYPGWHCWIDGTEAPIIRAEEAFQSVSVSAGSHRIRFQYSPASVRIGAIISAISTLAFALWLWLGPRAKTGGNKIEA